jgi:hypothetical protein
MEVLKRISLFIFAGFIAAAFLFVTTSTPAHAQNVEASYQDILNQGIIFAGICTKEVDGVTVGVGPEGSCPCRDAGDCTLDDVMQVFVNVSVFILGISGSITLLVMIIGGFTWLTSGGSVERVRKGKQIMVGAVIGLIIIFGAYAAITLLVSVLTTGEIPEDGTTIESVTQ